jgi:exopolysaccharide biosynthesis polyprenyl glycosylphosphotransferase
MGSGLFSGVRSSRHSRPRAIPLPREWVIQPVSPDPEPETPEFVPTANRHAEENFRRHTVRALRRFLVLLFADLAALALWRIGLAAVREGIFGTGLVNVFPAAFPHGLSGETQFAVGILAGLFITGNYGTRDHRRDAGRLLLGCMVAYAFPLWTVIWSRGAVPVVLDYGLATILVWIILVVERNAVDLLGAWLRWPEKHAARTLFVGPAADCRKAAATPPFSHGIEYVVVGYVEIPGRSGDESRVRAGEVTKLIRACGAETVVVCGYLADQEFHDVVDSALASQCQLLSVPRAIAVAGVQPTVIWNSGRPLIELNAPVVRAPALILKRLVDLLASSLGLAAISPLLLLIAICVKLDSSGPVFFGSERWGRAGRKIRIWKFRTMVDGAARALQTNQALREAYEQNVKLHRDPRVTRVGQWLRRWSLDELPQLFNVFSGEMSLVGPRPKLMGEEHRYGPMFGLVLAVPPGMTGLWQVSGRSETSYEDRIALDVDYVRRCSISLDLSILLRTMPAVLRGVGAH